jgi:WW domain-containing oxidoreductase
MTNSIPFGKRATADQVLAGIDLTGKRIVVTGCNSGLGFATMNAFAANGATVIGLARSIESATRACAEASPNCIPVACDLTRLDSVAAAVDVIRNFGAPLDAIVANAGVALNDLQIRYGIELNLLTNHIGHFALVNGLAHLVRDRTGRIVMVSSGAAIKAAPAEGILFDNLDGRRFFRPDIFYGQSKLANALYAKELSRRLSSRGVAVNSADPGAARTRMQRGVLSRLFAKPIARAAATQALLAASPQLGGISGEFWQDCKVSKGPPALLQDAVLARRLWDVSEELLSRSIRVAPGSLLQAA